LKFGIWVTIVVLIAQLLLAVTPFVPITAQYWHTDDPQQFYGILGSFVGIELIFLTAALSLILLKESSDTERRLGDIRAVIPGATVNALTEYDFYRQFRAAAEQSRNSVSIAYFAPYPPDDVTSKDRKKYDEEIIGLMKRNAKVNFRRLIRDSKKNRPWIIDLVDNLKGRGNVNVAVLTCDLSSEEHEMPLSLSVQIVDQDKVWIVAAGSHQTEGEFRDVYIENGTVAATLTDYYDRLWSKSVLLLDHGRITEDAEELIESAKS
jgi:hypothetical protein